MTLQLYVQMKGDALRPVDIHVEFITAAARWINSVGALVGFVGAHGDAFEFFEFAEEFFDRVAPFVHCGVRRNRLCSAPMLGDKNKNPAQGRVLFDDKRLSPQPIVAIRTCNSGR